MLSSARGVIRSTAPSAAPAGAPGHHSERGERSPQASSPSRPTRVKTHKNAQNGARVRRAVETSRESRRVRATWYTRRNDGLHGVGTVSPPLRPACAEVSGDRCVPARVPHNILFDPFLAMVLMFDTDKVCEVFCLDSLSPLQCPATCRLGLLSRHADSHLGPSAARAPLPA